MNKTKKLVLTIVVSFLTIGILTGGILFFTLKNIANAKEYKLGNDTIASINAIVDKRKITSVSTETSNAIKTKSITYKSNSVHEDLDKYIEHLTNEEHFTLLKNVDLSLASSTVQLGKDSKDPQQIIVITITYDPFGYTIILQKGDGSLPKS